MFKMICPFRTLRILALGLASLLTAFPVSASSPQYKLTETFQGQDFFNHFEFETSADPTHGYVDYVDQSRAQRMNLISVDPATQHVFLRVESKHKYYSGGRPSVRLRSKSLFNQGIILFDAYHIPDGNSVWPAFWTYGANWPHAGEIDIIEGKNRQTRNEATLHSGPGCEMPPVDPEKMLGEFPESLDCHYVLGAKGCTTLMQKNSLGRQFNEAGGGVFALLWNDQGMSVWFWPRSNLPSDIAQGLPPDPSQWGIPGSFFPFGENCSPDHFGDQSMILNTTLCGDWAGMGYVSKKGWGPDVCNAYAAMNPKAFREAYWEIGSMKTYSIQ